MQDNRENVGISEFRSKIKNLGIVFVTFALIANFIPAVYVSMVTGIFPSVGDLFKLWLAAAAAFGVGYFVQPISFFPMVNMAGSFMVWICGNVGELRVPAAAMAQKVTNCEQGSPKAEIMATIGIAASVFVSVTMITVFAIAGSQLMPLMPKAVLKGFGFILPAVLGAVYADLCGKNFVLGVIILISSILGTVFFPKVGVPGGMVMLVNILVAVCLARVYFLTTKKA
ncbi:MAG: hypothetical protein GX084_01180 [Acholeplasmataceae bacterium]|nr:hypothetical protein [Acidaminococcaceae bacterium]NLY83217.1 hypothetical protein [Acholeplasmataceae bacterium]